MGLDVPDLDDREYEDLMAEARRLIPAYAEEWTDFNPHDPGITMLELLAWLAESYVYQIDRVTDEHRRKYLQLVGEQPRPPTRASALLSLSPPADVDGVRVEAGTPLTATDGSEQVRRFETDGDVVLTAASIERVVTVDRTGATDNTHANGEEGMFYRAFGPEAREDDALYLGFDGDPFGAAALTLSVAYHDDDLPEPASHGDEPVTFDPSVEVEWAALDAEDQWVSLPIRTDTTRSMYGGGRIELGRPDDWCPQTEAGDAVPVDGSDGYTWVRATVRTPGYEIPPQFDRIAVNEVSASHGVSIDGERLERVASGRGPPGLDGQTYAFEHRPVLSATISVDGDRWEQVPSLDASGPDDPHYVLDRTEGTATFGDGETGRVPPPDATVVADYVAGGGEAGNVPPDSTWRFAGETIGSDDAVDATDVGVAPTGPASGGTEAESVDAALRRVRRDLRTPYRAVTLSDYEYVASHTPGLRVGRTNVVADGDEITVVVVPYAPPEVAAPEPSDGFLEAVREHVQRHRVLGDRVEVTGPRYVGLEVDVVGSASGRYVAGGHDRAIRTAVEEYIHPLRGFDGEGWPFGRPLDPAALADRLREIDALDRVSDVTLTAHGGGSMGGDGSVVIDDGALFSLEGVTTDLGPSTEVSE